MANCIKHRINNLSNRSIYLAETGSVVSSISTPLPSSTLAVDLVILAGEPRAPTLVARFLCSLLSVRNCWDVSDSVAGLPISSWVPFSVLPVHSCTRLEKLSETCFRDIFVELPASATSELSGLAAVAIVLSRQSCLGERGAVDWNNVHMMYLIELCYMYVQVYPQSCSVSFFSSYTFSLPSVVSSSGLGIRLPLIMHAFIMI